MDKGDPTMGHASRPRSQWVRSDLTDQGLSCWGGISSLSAAVFLIRDGDFNGYTIAILEHLDTIGDSLDG